MKKKNILKILLSIFLLLIITVISINIIVIESTKKQITNDINKLSPSECALLLGARVYKDNKVSQIVYDRILKAVELYKKGLVKKILISGDHGQKSYDEVNTMKEWVIKYGVPPKDIFMDHAGFTTYESIYRAKEIFLVDNLIIVTQEFHLGRSVFIANSFGLKSQGFVADRVNYLDWFTSNFRESFARIKAFFYVNLKPKPTYLGEIIPIEGDGRQSWD
ncbi:MAG: hypothetical protein A2086_14355 [Spirochaetes bacterium GWD1_27_9]|nr:MAG: hypothetical protein A2Z98_14420 [Spirochaetes bacterium GWB1_27_13]OHD26072.1 MAG: hypothetical protein A2Y34_03675 [Spirochaetes bacterium GWC1_27_15]OHD41240.1 MAG: hypothetical protein A2086_14355 [Spirochaetes bacterium GWD1_27_9]